MSETPAAEYLTLDQAAAVLQVRRSWVAAKARTGALPAVRLGKHIRINRGELLRWAERQGNGKAAG